MINERVKTHKEHLRDVQSIFNEFIRERDKSKPCICCDKELTKIYHAGHFFSVGSYPGIRFDEANVHAQREDCNMHKGGNHSEYAIRLPYRIGKSAFEKLEEDRHEQVTYTIPELTEMKKYYRDKINNLKINIHEKN